MKQKLPFKYSYKVTDTFYAGEYPFKKLTKEGIPKLQGLLDFGIETIIDLTSEPLTPYDEHLPDTCVRHHFPTADYTCPDFSNLEIIHMIIEEIKEYGDKIYVHCKGGHDRTGVVVATYFIHAGFSPLEAKQKFYEVFVPPVKSRYPHLPLIETKWKILDQYKKWLQEKTTETKQRERKVTMEGYDAIDCFEGRHIFITEISDEVYMTGLSQALIFCVLADGQPMRVFGEQTAFKIGTLKELDGRYYFVADNDDYFNEAPKRIITKIDGKDAILLSGYVPTRVRWQ